MVHSPLRLAVTDVVVHSPLRLAVTNVVVHSPLRLAVTNVVVHSPLRLAVTDVVIHSPLRLVVTNVVIHSPLRLAVTNVVIHSPNLRRDGSISRGTSHATTKESYQYTASVDINNTRYKRTQSLIQNHSREQGMALYKSYE